VTIRLRSNGPTDLALSNQPVTEHQADRSAFADGALYRASWIDGAPAIIRAWSVSEDEIEFEVTPAEDRPLPSPDRVAAFLRRKFALDLDLPAFYLFAKKSPRLARLPGRLPGLRPILKDSLLEALCLAIADQQVNVAFAATLKQRLLSAYGTCYPVDGLQLWLHPSAETLAQLDPEALAPLQFTRSKSRYIVELARRFLAEPRWETLSGNNGEIIRRLCTLRGVGPWTAEYAGMVGLGLKDTLPSADIALIRMVQRIYNLPQRPTEREVRQLARDWSPWRGIVTFYLWQLEDMET